MNNLQRGIYQPYILVMQLEALVLLQQTSVGSLNAEMIIYCVLALAAACVGVAVFKRLTTTQFNTAVYALLVISGASLLASVGARVL